MRAMSLVYLKRAKMLVGELAPELFLSMVFTIIVFLVVVMLSLLLSL